MIASRLELRGPKNPGEAMGGPHGAWMRKTHGNREGIGQVGREMMASQVGGPCNRSAKRLGGVKTPRGVGDTSTSVRSHGSQAKMDNFDGLTSKPPS